jgi:hypothetical protein
MAEHRKSDPTEEYVRAALQDAAKAHRPNREAMVDRVAVGRARSRAEAPRRSRPLFSMRPVGAAAAVVSVVIASMFAARLADGAEDDGLVAVKPPPVAAVPGTNHPDPTTPVGTAGPQRTPDDPPASTPAAPPTSTPVAPPASVPAQPPPPPATTPSTPADWLNPVGYVDPNSSDAWSQNTVRISNTKPITALEITIAVARTAQTENAGRYTTAANDFFTMTVNPQDDKLMYSYVLRDGATLKPGKYLFAAQYTHGPDHKATVDSFSVVAETRSADTSTSGTFTAKP